jgi:hypothetical protein
MDTENREPGIPTGQPRADVRILPPDAGSNPSPEDLMKRLLIVVLLIVTSATFVDVSHARRVVVRHAGRGHVVNRRTVVVVHRGWPLRRPLRPVVVRPVRRPVRVATAAFLVPVVWTTAVVAYPPSRDVLVWQDSETLSGDDGWTEFTLDCDARGRKLYLEVAGGRVQLDWAEVVFENGEAQIVDFSEKTLGTGLYSLLDFRDGRKVDHVRVVARAKPGEAKVALQMEK